MPMRHLLPGLVIALLLVGYASALTPQEAMMEALETGNYSTVEPYLSKTMKEAFPESLFKTIREGLVNQYGEIKGYELEKTESRGDYTVYYYHVIAERGNYTVSVTVRDGKVEGFHLTDFKPNLRGSVYPLLGGLVGLLALWLYMRRISVAEILFGALLLVPVLLFQPLVQKLPVSIGIGGTAFIVLWTGLIAGLFQEPLKYYTSRDKPLDRALYIGAGFGLGETIYVAVTSALLGGASWPALIERTLALLFHASTTLLFAYSWRNGWGRKALISMVLVHWLIDSIASYWHVNPSTEVIIAGYTVMLFTALVVLIKLLPLARIEKETKVKW